MPTLISSIATELESDFSIMTLHQRDKSCELEHGTFAHSDPTGIFMTAGSKYPTLRVVVQRWDSRPQYERGYEDFDEVPFQADPDAGPVVVSGFDPMDEPALEVTGLGRARALIYARGRHAGDGEEGLRSTEDWLIQLYPDPEGLPALVGDPRRLATDTSFHYGGAWRRAFMALGEAGWDSITLGADSAWRELSLVLHLATGAMTRAELVARTANQAAYVENHSAAFDAAVEAVIDVLLARGLLLTWQAGTQQLLVVNPSPPMVWDVLSLDTEQRQRARASIGRLKVGWAEQDVSHLARWEPDKTMTTTARHLALRLSLVPSVVLDAINLLRDREHAAIDVPADRLDIDTPVTIRLLEGLDRPVGR